MYLSALISVLLILVSIRFRITISKSTNILSSPPKFPCFPGINRFIWKCNFLGGKKEARIGNHHNYFKMKNKLKSETGVQQTLFSLAFCAVGFEVRGRRSICSYPFKFFCNLQESTSFITLVLARLAPLKKQVMFCCVRFLFLFFFD